MRSVLIHKEYRPPQARLLAPRDEFTRAAGSDTLTADDLLRRYCTLVYSQTGSYEETARWLHLDRRGVKSKVDPQFLAKLCRNG